MSDQIPCPSKYRKDFRGHPLRKRPGPGGPVPVARSAVARSRWPGSRYRAGPVFAVARWPGPGPGPCHLSCPWSGFGGPVARSRSRSRLLSGPGQLWWRWPGPGPVPVLAPGRVPVPIKRITYAVRPASSNLFQENGGSTLFSKPLVRGKQYCEVETIIEQKQEPNGCQSQLLDIKTLDVASWAAVSVCSRNTNVTMVWAWMLS